MPEMTEKQPRDRVFNLLQGTFQPLEGSITSNGIVCFHGSWNKRLLRESETLRASFLGSQFEWLDFIQVDGDDDCIDYCLGDNGSSVGLSSCIPSELPALLVVARQEKKQDRQSMDFIRNIKPRDLFAKKNSAILLKSANKVLQALLQNTVSDDQVKRRNSETTTPSQHNKEEAIRIFVAGDRSSVGKSSVCLGILGNLLAKGYQSSCLAYIKPATQCEAPQLVQAYCDKMGIACIPVGPIVYYKGFTRAFLAGETESSEELLALARDAVNDIAKGKKVILIDGVGFPAVGSICGTDNAAVARACSSQDGTPPGVLVVSPPGVGNAVDSFNLNASYFLARNVHVIGAIFNKLPLEGFYSLENCRLTVTAYFDQYQIGRKAFGFVPLYPELSSDAAIDHVDEFIRVFANYVNVEDILSAASREKRADWNVLVEENPGKKQKKSTSQRSDSGLSREQIEKQALIAGAAPSA